MTNTPERRSFHFEMYHLYICVFVTVVAFVSGFVSHAVWASLSSDNGESILIPHEGDTSVKLVAVSDPTPEAQPESTPEPVFTPVVLDTACLAQVRRSWTDIYIAPDRMRDLLPIHLGTTLIPELHGLMDETTAIYLKKDAFVGLMGIYRRAVFVEGQPVQWDLIPLGTVIESESWAYMAQIYLFKADGTVFYGGREPTWVELDDLRTVESKDGCRSF